MDYLLSHFGLWLAAIFAIGALTALMRRRAEADGGLSPWLAWGLLAFIIGLVVAGVSRAAGPRGPMARFGARRLCGLSHRVRHRRAGARRTFARA